MMALVTKEIAEAGSSAEESKAPPSNTPAKPTSGSLRSDAVSLEVPVKIHGSLLTAVIRDVTPQTEPFEEQTSTMIVFPQGGVLRMATSVSTGQMLVLTNLKSRQDAICRVVKVRSFANMQSYVEVEFTQPQPKYWGVFFASEGTASKKGPATRPAQPDAATTVTAESKPTPSAVQKTPPPRPGATPLYSKELSPAKPASVPAAPPKPASSFVSIGTQEEIQPAAASTSAPPSPRPSEKQAYVKEQPKNDIVLGLSLASAVDTERLPLQDANNLAVSPIASEPASKHASLGVEAIANTDTVLGSLENEGPLSDNTPSQLGSFGTRMDAGIVRSTSDAAEPRQNWTLIAACIAILFGAVGGGVWYFRGKAAATNNAEVVNATASAPQSTVASATQAPTSPSPLPEAMAPSSPISPTRTDVRDTPRETPPVETSAAASPRTAAAKSEDSVPSQGKSAAGGSSRSAGEGMFGSKMKAHPLSSARSIDSPNQAPTLDATADSASQPQALPVIGLPNAAVPPPPGVVPGTPASSGGALKEPQLVSSVLPVYPSVARQAHVQGDVVIDTYIDKSGNVARMEVVSGPGMLRQAALDALRRWKYKPSQLNGQPIEGELLVKIKFRL